MARGTYAPHPLHHPHTHNNNKKKQARFPSATDDIQLFGYFLKADGGASSSSSAAAAAAGWRSAPTVVYLQGNAGNVGHRVPVAVGMQRAAGCNVLLLAYRGYRGSSAHAPPSEEGLSADAAAALRYVAAQGVDTAKVFVVGTSLGGAVALAAALDPPYALRGVALENTFTSVPDVAGDLLTKFCAQAGRYLEARRRATESRALLMLLAATAAVVAQLHRVWALLRPVLCSLRWDSHARVRELPAALPVLFLSGARDELIPPPHMHRLHAACSSTRKTFVSFPDGMHNNMNSEDGYYEALAGWMAACLSEPLHSSGSE